MSPFFGSPAFIAATHDDRVRRLRQIGRLRRGDARIDGRRHRS
jgi:hypothetical protein